MGKKQTFEEHYWKKNYSEPKTMDCIGNAKEHAEYIKLYFSFDFVDISSVMDFGVGLGYLFSEVLKKILPSEAYAIEPSEYALKKAKRRLKAPVASMKLQVEKMDLAAWAERSRLEDKKKQKIFDLGICTSVFQYLSEEELRLVVPEMARRTKYLYLTVPTDVELKRMQAEVDFVDPYALSRPQGFYLEILRPHFTIVGRRILESKRHFDIENTFLNELLFRF